MTRMQLSGCLVELPAHINFRATIKTYGYDPRLLKAKSLKLVILICPDCKEERCAKLYYAIRSGRCRACGYIAAGKSGTGHKWTDEQKEGVKGRCAGKTHTVETKIKIAEAVRGRKHSEETKEKLKCINKGKSLTEETKKKLSVAHTGRKMTEENRQALILANTGVRRTEEYKRKMKEYWGNEDVKKKVSGPNSSRYGIPPAHCKRYWYIDSNKRISLRSSWEIAFAYHLNEHGQEWTYENETFQVFYELDGKQIDGTYTPDFKCGDLYYEVKGWWSPKGLAKFQAFCEQYPDKQITVIDKKKMTELGLLPISKEFLQSIQDLKCGKSEAAQEALTLN